MRLGMEEIEPRRLETEALIEAIWGPQAVRAPTPATPVDRQAQNRALAEAMKAYLLQYLAEIEPPPKDDLLRL